MTQLAWIDPHASGDPFPDVARALREPDGLLAVGGNLTPALLLNAYRRGIFPWYSDDQPILWWSPDPRAVIAPTRLRVSRSLRKTLRRSNLQVSIDQSFATVITACAAPRPGQEGTWITDAMRQAYSQLATLGHAHSVETWLDNRLVGGLYGIAIGSVFFGESMFSFVSDASKVALVHLSRTLQCCGYRVIDCQVGSDHLRRLGAENLSRKDFVRLLDRWCLQAPACPIRPHAVRPLT